MRYTEQELRDFLAQQAEHWYQERMANGSADEALDYAYAYGAQEAYEFVLRFMDEYKLEEVTA